MSVTLFAEDDFLVVVPPQLKEKFSFISIQIRDLCYKYHPISYPCNGGEPFLLTEFSE